MAKSLADMRDALAKVEATHEESWTNENFAVELTRGLTAIENARMEWNAARLKFPALSGGATDQAAAPEAPPSPGNLFAGRRLWSVGLQLTWPLAIVALLALGVFVVALLRR